MYIMIQNGRDGSVSARFVESEKLANWLDEYQIHNCDRFSEPTTMEVPEKAETALDIFVEFVNDGDEEAGDFYREFFDGVKFAVEYVGEHKIQDHSHS